MNAIQFLLKEHVYVKKMLADIANNTHRHDTKKKQFDALCQELTVHEKMEQTEWYPCFKHNDELKAIIEHLMSEEKAAEKSMDELKSITSEEEWKKKFLAFKSDVEHHASEEEKKLFPQVQIILDEAELASIEQKMVEFKRCAYDREDLL